MASIWFKILQSISKRNLVLQEIKATTDTEVRNIENPLVNLQFLWDKQFIMNAELLQRVFIEFLIEIYNLIQCEPVEERFKIVLKIVDVGF